ncbi:MAG: helix-turn-helix domain-containing protein [Persicimonas sp.]
MDVELDKEVFTTFEAAKVCNANITSIKNWIDRGELSAFRTPGGHYRIERKVLVDFLNRHDMPNPFAEHERRRVLLVHPEPSRLKMLSDHFGKQYDYEATDDAYEALLEMGRWRPNAAIVDDRIEDLDLARLCEIIESSPELRPISIVALHDRGEEFDEKLEAAGCAYTVYPRCDQQELFEAVRRALL